MDSLQGKGKASLQERHVRSFKESFFEQYANPEGSDYQLSPSVALLQKQ